MQLDSNQLLWKVITSFPLYLKSFGQGRIRICHSDILITKKKICLLCKIYGGKILHSGVYYDDDRGHKLKISKIDKLICKNFLFILNTLLMPIHVIFFFIINFAQRDLSVIRTNCDPRLYNVQSMTDCN